MATKEQQYSGRLYTQAEVDAKVLEARIDELEHVFCLEEPHTDVNGKHPHVLTVSERREQLKAEKEQTNDQL